MQQELDQDIIFFLFASSMTLVIVVTGFVLFVSLFFKAKRKAILEREAAKLNFQKELNRANSEIQIETLNHIGRELHDNIVQLLVVSKIHAEDLAELHPSKTSEELKRTIHHTIQEIRDLSRSLNSDRFEKIGFENALKLEAERINKLKGMHCNIHVNGASPFPLDLNRGLILFRILQEFIANTLKHGGAKNIDFTIENTSHDLRITGQDDGVGFYPNEKRNAGGSGMLNMQSRSRIIGAALRIESKPEQGTKIEIHISKNSTDEV